MPQMTIKKVTSKNVIKNKSQHLYHWQGINAKGERVQGKLEGSTAIIVKTILRNQGISLTKIRKNYPLLFTKKISSKEITYFTRQLATLLTAGIPLISAFTVLARSIQNSALKKIIIGIKTHIEEGHTFIEALSNYPNYFNELYCNLIAAGEQSGTLATILERLATDKEKTELLKGKIRKALFYPITVVVIAVVVSAALLIYVVPQFEILFKSFSAELPYLTRIVIACSRFAQAYWLITSIIIVFICWGFSIAKQRYKKFSYFLQRVFLSLPIVGPVLEKATIARFSRTLATTFAAGIPLVEGLTSAAKATGNYRFRDAAYAIRTDISKGLSLQIALINTTIFPEIVIQMATIGEQSGSLDQMLTKVASIYEEEVDNSVEGLSTLLEPIIMCVLGVLVGILVIAMYLPIFKLGSIV